jgi:hypothetical protein
VTHRRPFEPGSACKDGKLYLFTGHDVLVVRAWPLPRAWRRSEDVGWHGARPLRLELDAPDRWAALPEDHGLREYHLRLLRNQAAAFEPIPQAQRLEAARFGDRAWPLHVLFSRVPGALDLARTTPALAVGLAFHGALRPQVSQPLRSARTLLAQPGPRTAQRVAGWLGFDASRTVVRNLRKLEHHQCTPWKLGLLQRALGDLGTYKLLCHLPSLNSAVFLLLELLLDPAVPVVEANGLALDLCQLERDAARAAETQLRETAYAWAAAFPGKPLPRLRSLTQLEELYVDASVKLGAPVYHWGGRRQLLPPPPVLGLDTPILRIQPLSSPAKHHEEGRAMAHCVGNQSHIMGAARGKGYGYAVRLTVGDTEHRATAWVVARPDRAVRIASLRARLNHKPSPEIVTAVLAWIDAHNQAAHEGRLPPLECEIAPPPSCESGLWSRNWQRFGMVGDQLEGVPMEDGEVLEYDDMPF